MASAIRLRAAADIWRFLPALPDAGLLELPGGLPRRRPEAETSASDSFQAWALWLAKKMNITISKPVGLKRTKDENARRVCADLHGILRRLGWSPALPWR
jgi:hypothetical protein